MTKLMIRNLIFGGVFVGGAGVAAAVTIPVITSVATKKTKDLLGNFALVNHEKPVLNKDGKYNYLALGDSVTAGYNGFVGKDYLSYADFIGQDLKNHDLLNKHFDPANPKSQGEYGYLNLATSGDTIDELNTKLKSAENVHALKNADIISVSIGGNDLLRAVKLLDVEFSTDVTKIFDSLMPSAPPAMNSAADGLREHQILTPLEHSTVVNRSLDKLGDLLKTGDLYNLLNIRNDLFKDSNFFSKTLDIMQQKMAAVFRNIYEINNHAKVYFVIPPMPMKNWPSSFLNHEVELKGEGTFKLSEIYSLFAKRIQTLLDAGADGLVTVINGDEIEEINAHPDIYMANRGDIHPILRGHDLIAQEVWKNLASDFDITTDESKIQHYVPADDDENTHLPFEEIYRERANNKGYNMVDEVVGTYANEFENQNEAYSAGLTLVHNLVSTLIGSMDTSSTDNNVGGSSSSSSTENAGLDDYTDMFNTLLFGAHLDETTGSDVGVSMTDHIKDIKDQISTLSDAQIRRGPKWDDPNQGGYTDVSVKMLPYAVSNFTKELIKAIYTCYSNDDIKSQFPLDLNPNGSAFLSTAGWMLANLLISTFIDDGPNNQVIVNQVIFDELSELTSGLPSDKQFKDVSNPDAPIYNYNKLQDAISWFVLPFMKISTSTDFDSDW